jgi:DNA-directed RNA polymerase subunit RPC12/RpoP
MAPLTQDEWWAWIRTKEPDPSMPFRAVVFMKPGRERTAIYCLQCGPAADGAAPGVIFDARGIACRDCGVRVLPQ